MEVNMRSRLESWSGKTKHRCLSVVGQWFCEGRIGVEGPPWGGARRVAGHFDSDIIKLLAVRDGHQLAFNWGIPISCVECDAQMVINGPVSFSYSPAISFIYLNVQPLLRLVGCDSYCFILKNGNKI